MAGRSWQAELHIWRTAAGAWRGQVSVVQWRLALRRSDIADQRNGDKGHRDKTEKLKRKNEEIGKLVFCGTVIGESMKEFTLVIQRKKMRVLIRAYKTVFLMKTSLFVLQQSMASNHLIIILYII